jgi:uncharacterized membrane protein
VSNSLHALSLFVHIMSAVVWLGGMIFAHTALRPAAVQVLEPPQRLPLLSATLGRFFKLVAVAVIAIVATGFFMIKPKAGAPVPIGWWVMAVLGLVMAVNFAVIGMRLYPRLRRHVAQGAWPDAARALDPIRALVHMNLWLGVGAVAAAVAARG